MGSPNDMKPTSGYVFKVAVGGLRKEVLKQTITASSTMHVAFIVFYETAIQAV